MSVKVHEPVCLDSAQDLYFWGDHFLGDQLKDEWAVAGVGSAAVVDAQTGGIVRLTTGATDGNSYEINWGAIRTLRVLNQLTIEFRAKLNSITDLNVRLSLEFDATNFIQFFEDRPAAVGNWELRTRDGGALTTVDSGIALDTDYHIYRIECFPTDEIHFYIDDVETANSPITTNIPNDAGDYLQPRIRIGTGEDVAKSMDIDYVVVRQKR